MSRGGQSQPPVHRDTRSHGSWRPAPLCVNRSCPLWGGPIFRHWPPPPGGNPRSRLGRGLPDVCEKGRLSLLIRILQTMGRQFPLGSAQETPTGRVTAPCLSGPSLQARASRFPRTPLGPSSPLIQTHGHCSLQDFQERVFSEGPDWGVLVNSA